MPVVDAEVETVTLTESAGDPVVTKYYFAGGKRVAMDREGVVQWLVGDHLGTTSVVLNANATASQREFLELLLEIHSRPDLLERFPWAVDLLNQALETLE